MGLVQTVANVLINSLIGLVSILGAWTLVSLFLHIKEARHPEPDPPEPTAKRIVGSLSLSSSWDARLAALIAERAAAQSFPLSSEGPFRLGHDPLLQGPDASQSTPASDPLAAAENLIQLVIRDFIACWYLSISSDPTFVDRIQLLLRDAVREAARRLHRVSLPSLVVERLAPTLIMHVSAFRKAEQAVRGTDEDRLFTETQEYHELVASKYAQGRLHPSLHLKGSTQTTELAYLRSLADRLLPVLLPRAPELNSSISRILVREVLACAVLHPVVTMLSEPHFWNQTIDSLAGAAMRELSIIYRFRKILDEQTVDASQTALPMQSNDEFLRNIKACKSLIEAKKLRNQIVMDIRRRRLDILDRVPGETVHGMLVEDVMTFINQLLSAKMHVEKRIEELGGPPYVPRNVTVGVSSHHLSLTQLLASSTGLSYFMEFVDQSQRTNLLQCWLMAESFRQHLGTFQAPESLRQDFEQIIQLFFAPTSPKFVKLPLNLSLQLTHLMGLGVAPATAESEPLLSIDTAKPDRARTPTCTPTRTPTRGRDGGSGVTSPAPLAQPADPPDPRHLVQQYQPVLDAQTYVYQQMESTDFVQFVRSDLYLSLINEPGFVSDRDARLAARAAADASDYLVDLSLLSEEALLPSDEAVEAVEEELRTILTGDLDDDAATTVPAAHATAGSDHGSVHSRANSTSSAGSTTRPSSIASSSWSASALLGGGRASGGAAASAKAHLRRRIDVLVQQEAVLDSLLAKAQATHKDHELIRILEKSKLTIRDEMRELLWQEIQEDRKEPTLIVSGRCSVNVISNTVGTDGTKEFSLYVIEVKNLDSNSPGWIVTRRYSEFLALHQLLKVKFSIVQQYDLPKKAPNVILGNVLMKSLAESRQDKLGKYLQALCAHQEICDSEEFRRFICQEKLDVADLQARQARVTSGAPRSGVSLMRQLQQKIINGLDVFVGPNAESGGRAGPDGKAGLANVGGGFLSLSNLLDSTARVSSGSGGSERLAAGGELLSSSESLGSGGGSTGGSARGGTYAREEKASDVFAELFIEVFDLKDNWLRRQAVLIILQQILGETIDRKLVESLDSLSSPNMIHWYITTLSDALWPDGKWNTSRVEPTDAERAQTKQRARQKVTTLVPEILGSFVGRQNARKGGARLLSLLQNQLMNRHLLYSMLDVIVDEVFLHPRAPPVGVE
ncbi:hypothetical protein AMAG_05549 [Allomyces macrogynus ATCC 38327]|uniref:PXA domain-containing protein n=1 Tax=Allomyces macrogynus (strain ATCC 38327) TaxID=578462 RepID=A0A0L0SCB5_ALLM3|nr:hypothetical protein AMAG_05549 [Allomyces macrogynus ATCC 38327]|eukprot:KNE60126.1 hypothetical protein AMAG_05549 [Allomyces macrogynus ATCC 38327]